MKLRARRRNLYRRRRPPPQYGIFLLIGRDVGRELRGPALDAYAGELRTGEIGVIDAGFSFVMSPAIKETA